MGTQIIEPAGSGSNSLSGSMIKLMNGFQQPLPLRQVLLFAINHSCTR